eukprot:1743954-Pyramimonas_sp.AAC.2
MDQSQEPREHIPQMGSNHRKYKSIYSELEPRGGKGTACNGVIVGIVIVIIIIIIIIVVIMRPSSCHRHHAISINISISISSIMPLSLSLASS